MEDGGSLLDVLLVSEGAVVVGVEGSSQRVCVYDPQPASVDVELEADDEVRPVVEGAGGRVVVVPHLQCDIGE